MTNNIQFYSGENIPLELHKVRVVQKLHLVPVERRLKALQESGFNTFKLNTNDVFLDMLTDSGTNAMSDNQVAAMFRADDAYAGSQSFTRLLKAVQDVLERISTPGTSGKSGRKHHLPYFYQTGTNSADELPLHDGPRPYHGKRGKDRGTSL